MKILPSRLSEQDLTGPVVIKGNWPMLVLPNKDQVIAKALDVLGDGKAENWFCPCLLTG